MVNSSLTMQELRTNPIDEMKKAQFPAPFSLETIPLY
jgi:hypothetical protein